jgi:hypothetical protein
VALPEASARFGNSFAGSSSYFFSPKEIGFLKFKEAV